MPYDRLVGVDHGDPKLPPVVTRATFHHEDLSDYATSGVSSQGTQIQQAFTAAGGGVLFIPPGTWDLGSTDVTFGCSIRMEPGALLTYSGSGIALLCDDFDDAVIRGLNIQRSTLGWATAVDLASIGFQFRNCNRPKMYDPTIRNFWRGLNLHGDANGTSYGDIYLPELNDNMIAFSCTAVNAGWANSNNVFGGRFRINSSSAGVVGSKYIELITAGNGTNFFGTSLEDDNVELTADISKTFVTMFGCRLEQAAGIRLNTGGHYFQLIGGYGNTGPDANPASSGVPIIHNGGEGDTIVSGFGSQFSHDGGAEGSGLGTVFAATNAPSNNAITIKDDAGLIKTQMDSQGVIKLWRTPGKGGAVQPEESVKLDGANRRVWLGDGTLTPANYFSGASTTRTDFVGTVLRITGILELNGTPPSIRIGVNTTAPQILSGTGSPAGAVSAVVGSVYLRTDGGVFTAVYVKESGSSTSGWRALDTGGLPRTGTATGNAATPSINTDIVDHFDITALNTAITSMTTNLSGTPIEGQGLHISVTDNGVARAITWGALFEAGTATMPTTTVAGVRLDTDFVWNSATSKWRCLDGGGGSGFQPLDSDLTTIASLTATTDNMIQSVGSAWASRTPAQVKTALAITEADVTSLVTDLAAKQPLDADLTTIAGLTATTDNMIQSVAGAWASRTPAQVRTALGLIIPNLAGTAPNVVATTGEYWAPPAVHTTLALVAGRLYTKMVFVPRDTGIDRIGAAVTTGAASSTITLGIFEDDGTGNPGIPFLDAGTIDGNSATAQEITISKTLLAGKCYHLAAMAAAGTPTVRADDNTSTGWNGRFASLATATGTTSIGQGRFRDSISGTALPNPAATTGGVSRVPVITVRIA